jgi:hypothetical protein
MQNFVVEPSLADDEDLDGWRKGHWIRSNLSWRSRMVGHRLRLRGGRIVESGPWIDVFARFQLFVVECCYLSHYGHFYMSRKLDFSSVYR